MKPRMLHWDTLNSTMVGIGWRLSESSSDRSRVCSEKARIHPILAGAKHCIGAKGMGLRQRALLNIGSEKLHLVPNVNAGYFALASSEPRLYHRIKGNRIGGGRKHDGQSEPNGGAYQDEQTIYRRRASPSVEHELFVVG